MEVEQVVDQIESLNIMIEDMQNVSHLYRPTNYWAYYEKQFLPELLEFGLKDFRKRKNSVLSSFGATDLSPVLFDIRKYRIVSNKFTKKIPGWKVVVKFLNDRINSLLQGIPNFVNDFNFRSFEKAKHFGEIYNAKPIESVEASCIGNPENIFLVNGHFYTENFLFYYLRYCYCQRFIDFEKISTFVELGSGSGKQVELLFKLYPHTSYLLFDIPPQLYVCQQYLSAVFPGNVVPYDITRQWDNIPPLEPGKIYLFGTQKFPLIQELKIDLFWNCASFQEMEPEVVENYLKFVNVSSSHVYLYEIMKGKNLAKKEGEHGVLNAVTYDDYQNGLKSFDLVDYSNPLSTGSNNLRKEYIESFWTKCAEI